ncbi:TPA: type II toxin-antitoxin system PemK/MazF family toxin [Candidatus Woesearchaeota archaeon]|nr:type II toxin-antitoxin system PemK/MazF family toxin [Candidatus Woesearchaeota archaeon]
MMYSKGDIVIIEFPFSNLTNAKKRPMLVIAERGDDIIGCAITSNLDTDGFLIDDFEEGSLPLKSKVKYWQIHTFLKSLVLKKIARMSKKSYKELVSKIDELISK